jgi:hypothetical protein
VSNGARGCVHALCANYIRGIRSRATILRTIATCSLARLRGRTGELAEMLGELKSQHAQSERRVSRETGARSARDATLGRAGWTERA